MIKKITLLLTFFTFVYNSNAQDVTVSFAIDSNNGAFPTAGKSALTINGSWNVWQGWGVTLSDDDGDGIFTGNFSIADGTQFEFVIAATGTDDGWSGWGAQTGNTSTGANYLITSASEGLTISIPLLNSEENNQFGGAMTLSSSNPTCDDGIQNGDETGVDCGGSSCQPCTTSIDFDFETTSGFTAADGAVLTEPTPNTVTNGVNSSANVGEISAINTGDWSHIFIETATSIDFASNSKEFQLQVKGPRAIDLNLKVEGGSSVNTEVIASYSTPDIWQTLSFDFSSDTSVDKNKIVLFLDIQGAASAESSNDIFQIDNFKFGDIGTLSVGEIDTESKGIYPNPTTGLINVTGDIYNTSGQLVLKNSNDLSGLPSGLYFVRVITNGSVSTSKVVKR
jgi:hypothetical protein